MFDAKTILDALVRGASPGGRQQQPQGGGLEAILGQILGGGGQAQQQGGGGLADILGQVLGGAKPQQQASPQGGGGLSDILGQVLGGAKPQQQQAQAAPGGSISDILGQVLGGAKNAAGQAQHRAQEAINDPRGAFDQARNTAGQVFGQAKQGLGNAAHDLNQATGAGNALEQLIQQATGKVPAEVLQQLKDAVAQHQLAAGVAAGGLGGLLAGTKTGRGIAKKAAVLGGLALIGGLAYQAYQNWQAGQNPGGGAAQLTAPPKGSGFGEDAADTNLTATNVLRAMIAAAAADGVLDQNEKQAILGEMKHLGYDQSVQEWLHQEILSPASIEDLAQLATTSEGVIEIYTAARLAINPDTAAEQEFLAGLAGALQIDGDLASHIEAQVTNVRA